MLKSFCDNSFFFFLSDFETLSNEVGIFLLSLGNSFCVGIVEGSNPSLRSLLEGLSKFSVGLESSLSLSLGSLISLFSLSLDKLSSRVELEESVVVGKRVFLTFVRSSLSSSLNDGLDFVGVDDSCDVSVGKNRSVELVSRFLLASGCVGTEDLVELLEGGGSPDDESTDVTTRSELEEVKSVDIADINTY